MPDPHTPPTATPDTPASENADLMAEVTAAIAGETPPETPPAGDTPPVDNPGDNPPAAEDETPPAATDGATPPAGDNPGETPPATPPARASDEFGELPADAPVKTRERFEAMKTKFDEVATERDTFRRERDEAVELAQGWTDTFERTGATPDQFGGMVRYLTAINSGDPVQQRQALDSALEEVRVIAKHLGVEIGGLHDPLDDPQNKDLKDKVELEGLDRGVALELARNRATDTARTAAQQARETQTQQQAEQAQAIAAVKTLGEELRAADAAGFTAKYEALKANGTLDLIYQLPPGKWAPAMREAFAKLKLAAPAPDPRTHAPAPPAGVRQTANPSAGGGTVGEPASALEAVQRALNQK